MAVLGLVFAANSGMAGAGAPGAPRVFRAGAATSNVTPPLGGSMHGSMRDKTSRHVHDELHARCDVSADYFGMFAERVKELLQTDHQDPAFVAMMSNGTSGNINNVNWGAKRTTRQPYEQMRMVANVLADEVVKVRRGIEYLDWVALGSAQKEITLGVRRPRPEEIERAREIVAKEQAAGLRSIEETYARETLDLGNYPATVSSIIQVFRIGDLAINAIPCETFVEIGLELKKRSPFPATFTISLANGYNGYLPTVEHHALGGYETWRAKSSYLEIEAAPKIVSTLMDLLTFLRGGPNPE